MSTIVLELDDNTVSRLSIAAARSHKALPEWAAGELVRLADETLPVAHSAERERLQVALAKLQGIWKDRGTTDELMRLTRGEG